MKRNVARLVVVAFLLGMLPVGNFPVKNIPPGTTAVKAAGAATLADGTEPEKAGAEESHRLSNPVTDSEGVTTWDCVYFGKYWQSDTNGDGKADRNDEKQPVRWRVLSVDGDDAFLLADQNLDCQKYNDVWTEVTWETCTMRSWLNGYGAEINFCEKDYRGDSFLDNAFTSSERAAIRSTKVINADNPEYHTQGGNDTTDKVYLLSIDEVSEPGYGFMCSSSDFGFDERKVRNTAYAEAQGAYSYDRERGYWWLRSPGSEKDTAAFLDFSGEFAYAPWLDGFVVSVDAYSYGVRPALHLNLSSVSEWSYAGSVTSDMWWVFSETPSPGAEANRELRNPMTNRDGSVTWDCVNFGSYWQSDTNGDGKTDKNDEKQPVRWRVLSVDGDDAFLLADKNLDVQKYNDTRTKVTWETCTMRSWLNGEFLDDAFTGVNKEAILDTTVTNIINQEEYSYDIVDGKDTVDKIFLLSIDDVRNPAYGFNNNKGNFSIAERSVTRMAGMTGYARKDESEREGGGGYVWWLRSLGHNGWNPACVSDTGYVWYGDGDDSHKNGVRPALHLNLSSVSEWSYAGTVTVSCDKPDVSSPSPEGTSVPAPSATPTNAPVQSEEPSVSPGETATPSVSDIPSNVPVQPDESGKPTAVPDQTPGTQQETVNPFFAAGSQPEVPIQTAPSALQKPDRVTGLKLKAIKKGMQVRWKKSKGASGYEVWSSTSKKSTSRKGRTVKAEKITIRNLKKKKTYYVKVRAYVTQNGKKVYGEWSRTAKTRVK